jgi:hypothetical protein
MPFVLVRSKVRDFKTWKPVYDAHQPARTAAGLTEKYLFRSADDTNEIVILFEAQDLDRGRRLPRPKTCVRGCKNLAWSTSQTCTSLTGNGHLLELSTVFRGEIVNQRRAVDRNVRAIDAGASGRTRDPRLEALATLILGILKGWRPLGQQSHQASVGFRPRLAALSVRRYRAQQTVDWWT